MEDFGLRLTVLDAEMSAADGEVEAAGASAAGVEVEDALEVLNGRLVGVTVDDCGDAGCAGTEVEVLAGVEYVDQASGQLDGLGFGEEGAEAVGIDVAADGGDGGDAAECGQNVGVAHVAGVEDVVDSGEGGE